jgi:hypothetical protein
VEVYGQKLYDLCVWELGKLALSGYLGNGLSQDVTVATPYKGFKSSKLSSSRIVSYCKGTRLYHILSICTVKQSR